MDAQVARAGRRSPDKIPFFCFVKDCGAKLGSARRVTGDAAYRLDLLGADHHIGVSPEWVYHLPSGWVDKRDAQLHLLVLRSGKRLAARTRTLRSGGPETPVAFGLPIVVECPRCRRRQTITAD